MNRAPTISVVLIFLNEERFLAEAVASVLAQTHQDWELLLVDDGSREGSTALAREWERQHPDRIRYLEHEGHDNRGMSASRNLGLQYARGEHVAFLDADDVWLPGKLEQQLALLEAHPRAAIVCGHAKWWFSWTGDPADVRRDFVQHLNVVPNTLVHPPALLQLFLQDEFASLCDLLVRRSAIEAVGAYEPAFRGLYEDQVFHAKLCLNFQAFVAAQTWYLYRQHPQSCCHVASATGGKKAARGAFLDWLEVYFTQQRVADPGLWKVLRRELLPFRHPLLARLRSGLGRVKHSLVR